MTASPGITVAFVAGVTLAKWTRTWAERHPLDPLTVLPVPNEEQTAVLLDDRATLAFARLPITAPDGLSVIPLYEEQAHVVVPLDHAVAAAESVTLADLAELGVQHVIADTPDDAVTLVAANVGVAVMPQSLARLHARRDVTSRPVTDAATTRIALVWRESDDNPLIEEFIGIVRGRTAASSRGVPTPPTERVAPSRGTKKPQRGPARTTSPPRGQRRRPQR